jgi:hypothetical protein
VDDTAWSERAARAASDLEAHRQLTDAKIELRNSLVVEGVDSGRTTVEVARALRLSQGRVIQILAAHG